MNIFQHPAHLLTILYRLANKQIVTFGLNYVQFLFLYNFFFRSLTRHDTLFSGSTFKAKKSSQFNSSEALAEGTLIYCCSSFLIPSSSSRPTVDNSTGWDGAERKMKNNFRLMRVNAMQTNPRESKVHNSQPSSLRHGENFPRVGPKVNIVAAEKRTRELEILCAIVWLLRENATVAV